MNTCDEHGTEHIKWNACYHPDHMARVLAALHALEA